MTDAGRCGYGGDPRLRGASGFRRFRHPRLWRDEPPSAATKCRGRARRGGAASDASLRARRDASGEALDWENDDFVPASKANKKKKSKGGNKAQAKKQKADKVPPAPAAEALDWENDDFVPAGKAKKNKKKPKKNNAEAAPEAPAQAPTAAADALDWENDDFVPTGKAKNKKKPKKQAAAAMAPEAPVIDGGPRRRGG